MITGSLRSIVLKNSFSRANRANTVARFPLTHCFSTTPFSANYRIPSNTEFFYTIDRLQPFDASRPT